jgi:hypothetical protein
VRSHPTRRRLCRRRCKRRFAKSHRPVSPNHLLRRRPPRKSPALHLSHRLSHPPTRILRFLPLPLRPRHPLPSLCRPVPSRVRQVLLRRLCSVSCRITWTPLRRPFDAGSSPSCLCCLAVLTCALLRFAIAAPVQNVLATTDSLRYRTSTLVSLRYYLQFKIKRSFACANSLSRCCSQHSGEQTFLQIRIAE